MKLKEGYFAYTNEKAKVKKPAVKKKNKECPSCVLELKAEEAKEDKNITNLYRS